MAEKKVVSQGAFIAVLIISIIIIIILGIVTIIAVIFWRRALGELENNICPVTN